MASRETYVGYAQKAAATLVQNWFPVDGPMNWVQQASDFWHVPNVMTALTRLGKLTGKWDYQATAENALQAFLVYFDPSTSPDQRIMPAYYDDECWWGDLFQRLFDLTAGTQWMPYVNDLFLDLQAGWDDKAKGGVWWKRLPKCYSDNNKGSIENELYMTIAMGLYNHPPEGTDRAIYLAATMQTWKWMAYLLDSNGLVWGNLQEDGTVNPTNVPRPYTQGVVLGALWDLYKQSNEEKYLDSAQQIAEAAIERMVWPDGILQDHCERMGTCGNDQDPILFKGIYARCLAEFAVKLAGLADPARVAAAKNYGAFLQRNANAVWVNYPQGIYGMDWHTPQPNYQPSGVMVYDGSLQSAALDLFVSAAAVSQ